MDEKNSTEARRMAKDWDWYQRMGYTDKEETILAWYQTVTCFVNVYKTGKAYGGAEEGGWWYGYGELHKSYRTQCTCPIEDVVSMQWIEDYYTGEESMVYSFGGNHKDECPAIKVYAEVEDVYVNGNENKAQFLESFITAGGTWDMNSMDDAPSEFAGERITGGSYVIKMEDHKGEDYPSHRPQYS